MDTGFIQKARVIVDVLREQARSHKEASAHGVNLWRRHERLANKFAPTVEIRSAQIQRRFGFVFDLDLDLKRPVKPRWPESDVDVEGKPAGRRFSRTGPGMALCGDPPNQCRITGMPSQSEGPSGGARAFCLLLGCSKVRRRKGATKSRRYHDNGYVRISLVGASSLPQVKYAAAYGRQPISHQSRDPPTPCPHPRSTPQQPRPTAPGRTHNRCWP